MGFLVNHLEPLEHRFNVVALVQLIVSFGRRILGFSADSMN